MKRFGKTVLILTLTLAMALHASLPAFAAPARGSVTVQGNIVALSGGSSSTGSGSGGSSVGATTPKYKVTYDANGGLGGFVAPAVASDVKGTMLAPSAAGITHPDGYEFACWNTEADGTGVSYNPGDVITLTGNLTLYAQWKEPPMGSVHEPYLNGYQDGTFRPDSAITRAEVAVVYYRMLSGGEGAGNESAGFCDVASGAWYADAVNYLVGIGVINGYPDGTFKPNQAITRAELVTIAARASNQSGGGLVSFNDVANGHWAYGYISVAYHNGWINGYPDGMFRPERSITRAEAAVVINAQWSRAADTTALAAVICPYSDVKSSHWAYADIIEASVTHTFDRDGSGTEIWK